MGHSQLQASHLQNPADGLERLTAARARQALEAGEITSEQLVSACLRRMTERDSEIRAWAHRNDELVLEAARLSDKRRARGDRMGPLAGIPVGVKDVIDTRDFPTELGSVVFKGRCPKDDAFVVSQLKAAGAIIIGKTVTTELAFFGPGPTRNPHDLERTPGGSSSGSAAAVADFHVPLALGTQTAGSIIRPASYCGVVGFKPTYGFASRAGVLKQSGPLDTIGGFARTVEDIALLVDSIGGFDVADRDMVPGRKPPFHSTLMTTEFRQAPRVAVVRSPAWEQGDDAMKAAFEAFISDLKDVIYVSEPYLPSMFADAVRLQRVMQFYDIAENYGPIADRNPNAVSDKLKEVISEGRTYTRAQYEHASAKREALYEMMRPVFVESNVIVTPAATGIAPLGLESTGSPVFNGLWTYLQMPTVSLPLLSVQGMPVGVQLIGARGAKPCLLACSAWMTKEIEIR
jgi:Asp-tRNA(Asn)/Glu-tRNA(Gln) amidotransferase A subunit family amidase